MFTRKKGRKREYQRTDNRHVQKIVHGNEVEPITFTVEWPEEVRYVLK